MSVRKGEDLGCRTRLCVRRASLSEDQGRVPGGYGTQIRTGKGVGYTTAFAMFANDLNVILDANHQDKI